MSVQTAYLKDDFEDNLIATAWVAVASGSATVAETGGQARFTLPSSTAGSHVARYTSRATYSLEGAGFFINIGTMVATGVAATAFFQLYLNVANAFQWRQESGTIYARKVVAGVSTDLFSAAWSGTTYKYLRISESAGTITWWSSTNGTTWTSRATLVGLPFAITDLFIDYGATCGNVASPGSFRLDDVNLLLPALTTAWNWTQVVWPFDERNERSTVAIDVAGTVMGYFVTADGVDVADAPSGNVRYFAGPMDAGRILTEQPTQAAAQAMAVYFPLDGSLDLEEMVEGHCYRFYHRSVDGASYIIRELFPRRLVQADDVEAESITALHIRAGGITADRLDVTELSAITADVGTLTGGVIDGVTIYAGSRAVALDINGLTIEGDGSVITQTKLKFNESGTLAAWIQQNNQGSTANQLRFRVEALSTKYSEVLFELQANAGASMSRFEISLDAGTVFRAYDNATGVATTKIIDMFAAVNIGGPTATASYGDISAAGRLSVHNAPFSATIAAVIKGFGTTNTTAAISVTNSTNLVNFQALDDGTIRTRKGNRWDIGAYVGGGTLTATGLTAVTIDGTAHFFLSR